MASPKDRFYSNQVRDGKITPEQYQNIMGKKYDGGSSSDVKNMDDAKGFINGNQTIDAASKAASNEPEIRASVEKYGNIASSITGVDSSNIKAPDAPNFENTFTNLRKDAGIAGLEDSLNNLNAEAENLRGQFTQTKADENGKFVTTNVAEGRIGEQGKIAQDKLDAVNRSITTITNQLNTAYKVIDMTMNYKGMDYNAAVASYNTKFNNQIQAMNIVKGIDDSIKTEQQHIQDNAQANLAVIYNTVGENGWKDMSSGQQAAISKLEAQAGFPQGFYKNIKEKNPDGEVVTTKSWQDGNGKEWISVVTRQKDGSLKTSNMYVGQGKASSGSGDNSDSRTQDAITRTDTAFDQLKGGDGKVSPEVWGDFRKKWTGSLTDFDSRFRQYVNGDHPADYAGFEEYRPGFRK